MTHIEPYLTFDGNCREAMTFYAKCLDADVVIMPFSDMPIEYPPDAKDRVMHARITKGSTGFMASDTMPGMPLTQGNNFSLSINCESAGEAERLFGALGEGGSVTMPLQQTFWAERFGMLRDRFGIQWMINLEGAKKA